MTTWDERFTTRPAPAPRVELLERCWRFIGPSQRVLACDIYHIETGIEVRVGYGLEDVLRTQLTPEIGTARELAAAWRSIVISKGGFEELIASLTLKDQP